MLENQIRNTNSTGTEDVALINSLVSELQKNKELSNLSYRVVPRRDQNNRYILFKKNSNVRDVIEISSTDINSIRWNGRFVSKNDFILSYTRGSYKDV